MPQLSQYIAGQSQRGVGGYRYFMPSTINEAWTWDNSELNSLLEKAASKVGELNAYARFAPNIDLFIQLHVTKEAVVSSRIEGTQTNISEAFLAKEDIAPEFRDDWQEVRNYIKALNQAIALLADIPISSRLLRQTHAILLDSVRGEHKLPGEFRTSQNWIGGATLADATFVPPHHEHLPMLMGDLENFLHNQDISIPALIRIGIAHYQFETIHPFLDGNGRIGRLLITLYLVSEGILIQPLLYLSSFFEKHKSLYYDNLTRVREKNDMLQWLKYFLVGVEQTASEAVAVLKAVSSLNDELEETIQRTFGRKSAKALLLLQALFRKPTVDVAEVALICGLSRKSANELVTQYEALGILVEVTGRSRNRIFSFPRYLSLF